ncbi:MAG: hypothetical protein GKR83_10300 [Synechococcus sp. s2_metabat2_7]|nr:hypothetical protein [Synechococcus sp. s2_metabat2_7]
MASGRKHDRATCVLALIYGAIWWPWLGISGAAGSAAAFLFGGLFLSPDLDINSRPYQRWGVLRWLWWPYQRLIHHRSVLSHSPFLGTAIRLAYLSLLVAAISWLGSRWGTPSPEQWRSWLQQAWNESSNAILIGLIGLEASAWLHLIQDGDPMPKLPIKRPLSPKRRRRRRG